MRDFQERAHKRYNPLSGEWILVSPERLQRPWLGEETPSAPQTRPRYDPSCYLCPGNVRASGETNPAYSQTYVFENDYPALLATPQHAGLNDGLLTAKTEAGRTRVVCFSPRHDLDIATMEPQAIRAVVDAWAHEFQALGDLSYVNAVTIFENRGSAMGASNPHPHGQIWANATIPNRLAAESLRLNAYAREREACLLCDYVAQEVAAQERIVEVDPWFCAVVPFWAEWPFELLLLPRRHAGAMHAMDEDERSALARAMHRLTARYDRLFGVPFPYSMGFHQRPTDDQAHAGWHLHAHYYPPLLRSAHVRKYEAGYEMLAQPQRDATPESAAERLRSLTI